MHHIMSQTTKTAHGALSNYEDPTICSWAAYIDHPIQTNNELLNSLLKEVCNSGKSHQLILGDFNYPNIDWDNVCPAAGANKPTTEFVKTIHDTYLFQHIRDPTHFRGLQQSNILDLILTNENDMVEKTELNAPLGKSHHSTILCTIKCYTQTPKNRKYIYKLDKGNYENVNRDISNIDWNHQMMGKSTNDCWDLFHTEMKKAIDKHIPR